MTPLDPYRWIEPWYWLGDALTPATPWTYLLLAKFGVVFAASLAVYLPRGRLFSGHRPRWRLADRWAPWLATFAGLGGFFVLLRVVGSPILTARFLWAASLVGFIATVARLAWHLRSQYPAELAEYEKEKALRRFIPKPKRRRR